MSATNTKKPETPAEPVPLEMLELQQENAALREELKYYRNRCARQQRYIDGQMKPLVRMGIEQAGKIKTLERRIKRLQK